MSNKNLPRPFFLILLSLLLGACRPTAQPLAPNLEPPSGVYVGEVDETGWLYPIQVIFEGCKKASACAQVDYPTFNCGGSFTFEGQEGGKLLFTEKIAYGADECLSGSTVIAAYGESDSTLELAWTGPDGGIGATAELSLQTSSAARAAAPEFIEGLGRVTAVTPTAAWINYPPVIGAGSLWVPNHDAGEVLRIDLETGALVDRIPAGSPVPPNSDLRWSTNAVAYGAGAIWVAQAVDRAVLKIDPAANQVVATIPVGVDPYDLVVDGDTLWVSAFESNAVVRIDIPSMTVTAVIESVYKPTGIAAGGGALWVALHRSAKVARIDPATNTVTDEIRVGGSDLNNMARPENVVFAYGYVWVANNRAGSLSRIDPATNEETQVAFPGRCVQRVAAGEGSIWIQVEGTQQDARNWLAGIMIVRIDPENLAFERWMIPGAWSLSVGEGILWLTDLHGELNRQEGERVLRIELLAVPENTQ